MKRHDADTVTELITRSTQPQHHITTTCPERSRKSLDSPWQNACTPMKVENAGASGNGGFEGSE